MSDSDSDAVSDFEPPSAVSASAPAKATTTTNGNGAIIKKKYANGGHVGTSRDGARSASSGEDEEDEDEDENASDDEERSHQQHEAQDDSVAEEAVPSQGLADGLAGMEEEEAPVRRATNGHAQARGEASTQRRAANGHNGQNGRARSVHEDDGQDDGPAETSQDHARRLKNKLRVIEEKSHAMAMGRVDYKAYNELVRDTAAIAAEAGGTDPAIAALATRVLKQQTMTVKNASKATKAEANSFDVGEFLEPLKKLLGHHLPVADNDAGIDSDEELEATAGGDVGGGGAGKRKYGVLGNWDAVGWMAVKRVRRVIGGEFMNGMMAVEHKTRVINRRQRQQQNRGQLAQEAQAVELKQSDAPKEDETIGLSKLLTKQLMRLTRNGEEDAINLFKWFINPRDFGQSVENLFLTSFIIREAGAAITIKEQVPLIYACEPPSGEDLANSVFKKRQVVMELTEKVWKKAIDLFDIRESMIPHREKPAELIAEELRRARMVMNLGGAGLPPASGAA